MCWWLHFSVTFKIYIISHSQAKAARKGNFKGMFSTYTRQSLEQATKKNHLHVYLWTKKKHKIESFKSCVVQFFTNISLQYRLISSCSILVERLFILFKNFLLLYYTFPLLNCMERSLMRWHRGKIEIICTVSLSGERLIWVWDTKIIYGSRFHVKFLICQFLFLYLIIDFAPLFVKLLLAGEIWFSGVT